MSYSYKIIISVFLTEKIKIFVYFSPRAFRIAPIYS